MQESHFVYLYRNAEGQIQYVGYGGQSSRATSHLSGSHNEKLAALVKEGHFTLEISGPYGDQAAALAVETALISAIRPAFNVQSGSSAFRFRPAGVPIAYAERLTLPSLTREDFARLQQDDTTFMMVKIGDKDFGDGRKGWNVAQPLEDTELFERMKEWWKLDAYIEQWMRHPQESPAYLIAVHGSPGAQTIIGAATINQREWSHTMPRTVPLVEDNGLDALQLRGRRIDSAANLKFGMLPHQMFLLLSPKGELTGGWTPPRNTKQN